MLRACQLSLRGFKTKWLGEEILDTLEVMGFTIKKAYPGESDSCGGLIETYITPECDLSPPDVDKIRARVSSIAPADLKLLVQYKVYELVEDNGFDNERLIK